MKLGKVGLCMTCIQTKKGSFVNTSVFEDDVSIRRGVGQQANHAVAVLEHCQRLGYPIPDSWVEEAETWPIVSGS